MGEKMDARGTLAEAFMTFCPSPEQIIVPPGYRDSAFALVDAVFSMQARYEGARRVVGRYAAWAGATSTPGLPVDASVSDRHGIADLHTQLQGTDAQTAATDVFGNRSRSAAAGRLKAELVIEAAANLLDVDVRHRGDVAMSSADTDYQRQKQAWSRIHGLGPVTFEYFRMLCGAESAKPDTMVLSWLEATTGERCSWQHALALIADLTEELSDRWGVPVLQRGVDHTIWRQQSGRGLDPDAPVAWNAAARS